MQSLSASVRVWKPRRSIKRRVAHMRCRAPALAVASLLACALTPAAANAASGDYLRPYEATVDSTQAATLEAKGFDLQEGGYDPSITYDQQVGIVATAKQAAGLESDGISVAAEAPQKAVAKSKALGDSPNPYFNVYRSYSEPGGIADQMRATAAANPDVMKLEQIGTSTLGKPILVIKMTADARNVADGSRPALLFSAVNHAREWLAAEEGRRLPLWFAEHKNDPEIKALLQKEELWFEPIMNVD